MAQRLDELLRSRGVPAAGPDHSHWKSGWTHVCCPHCGDAGFHLGFPDGSPVGRCFKCGHKGLADTLKLLLRTTWHEARALAESTLKARPAAPSSKPSSPPVPFSLPVGAGPLGPRHTAHLTGRGFSPAEAAAVAFAWGLLGTEGAGEAPWSLVVPVRDAEGVPVSWQARTLAGPRVGAPDFRWLTKPGTDIKRHLYGLHHIPASQCSVIIVEGPPSCWRLGAGKAVATFGADWTNDQLLLLARRFDRAAVCFDADPPGRSKGASLAAALCGLGVSAVSLQWWRGFDGTPCAGAKDPGELGRDEAAALINSIDGMHD